MGFDLSQYETVKERKKRFYSDNPDGRIIVYDLYSNEEKAFFRTEIYKNGQDLKDRLPWSTGHAFELRDKELSKDRYGKEYESVNYSSWVENCEESAIGRALDNAGYSSNNKCSQEEMKKVERMSKSKPPLQNQAPKNDLIFPSEFVFRFGKFKGKKMQDIDPDDLRSYLKFMKGLDEESQKKMDNVIHNVGKYLEQFKQDEPPEIDSNDEVPF